MGTFFIDFEASSLDSNSVPIEIAWVDMRTGQGESYLIKPEDDWLNWSLDSQKVHNISRPMLWTQGTPAATVARRTVTALRGAILVSDNPDYDGHWLKVLLNVIQETEIATMLSFNSSVGIEIRRLLQLISDPPDSAMFWSQQRTLLDEGQFLAATAIEPFLLHRVRHRALPDAKRLWRQWKAVHEAIDQRLKCS